MRRFTLALTVAMLAVSTAVFAAGFTLSANGLPDSGMLTKDGAFDKTRASDNGPCGGKNVAPGFGWTSPPAGTQSYALLMFDPDGLGGKGVSHWVLYNIPGNVTSLSTADIADKKFTPGRGTGDLVGYRGPCPPPGDAPHHYVLTLYATDLPPTLPVGLDRAGVLQAIDGHVKGATTTVMRYQVQ